MAKDPLYAWFIRGFFLMLLLLGFHLLLKGLEWTIGAAYMAALAFIAVLFIASWLFEMPIVAALAASAMMGLSVVFYAALRRFARFGDLSATMLWTDRAFAVLALASVVISVGLLFDPERGALRLVAMLGAVGACFLIFADSRFVIDPLLGPRPAARVTVEDLRRPYDPQPPLDGVAVGQGVLWGVLTLAALRRR